MRFNILVLLTMLCLVPSLAADDVILIDTGAPTPIMLAEAQQAWIRAHPTGTYVYMKQDGGLATRHGIPLFLPNSALDTLSEKTSWTDWVRINYGAGIVNTQGIAPVILVTGLSGGQKYPVLIADADGMIDVHATPVERALTYPLLERCWSEYAPSAKKIGDIMDRSTSWAVGVTTERLGEESTADGSLAGTGIFLGRNATVNQYFNIAGGVMVWEKDDEVHGNFAVTTTFDLALVGRIFGGK